jgi:hypothetical protein
LVFSGIGGGDALSGGRRDGTLPVRRSFIGAAAHLKIGLRLRGIWKTYRVSLYPGIHVRESGVWAISQLEMWIIIIVV